MPPNRKMYSYEHSFSRMPPTPVKRPSPLRKLAIGSCLMLCLAFIASTVVPSDPKQPLHTSSAVSAAAQTEHAPKRVVDTTGLQSALSETIKKYPYDTSVSVINLNDGRLYQSGDKYPFMAASTTKLLTAMVYLSNVESGKAGLDDQIGGLPARHQLYAMINKSDNNAWMLLNNRLDRANLASYAHGHGLSSYDPSTNTINSNDMATLMSKLYQRQLLNDAHTKILLSWMQNTSEERFIPPAVPKSNNLYHKSGYLEDRVHDVAIIDNGSAPFAIVIYSKSLGNAGYDYDLGQKLFSDVTKQVVTIFNQK